MAEAPGFRKETIRAISVLVDQIVSLDPKLEVGQITEIVEVAGGVTALIEPEKVSTGVNFDPSLMANLPQTNRRFADLALATPGATFAASASGSRSSGAGPGLISVDMSAGKTFPIRERVKLEYKADFFNMLNHTNFGVATGNRSMNNGSFGLMSRTSGFNGGDTGGARVIQMTLHLRF